MFEARICGAIRDLRARNLGRLAVIASANQPYPTSPNDPGASPVKEPTDPSPKPQPIHPEIPQQPIHEPTQPKPVPPEPQPGQMPGEPPATPVEGP